MLATLHKALQLKILLLLSLPIAAQVERTPLSFRQIGIDQGLSESRVTALFHAPGDFLWVGTPDGLNRYDGLNFKTYRKELDQPNGLPNNVIHGLAHDHRGRLLVTTDGGLARFRPDLDQFFRLTEQSCFALLPLEDGRLLVGTKHGLLLVDGSDQSHQLSFGESAGLRVNALLQDAAKRIWIGTTKGLFTLAPGLVDGRPVPLSEEGEPSITALCQDGADGLWIGSRSGLLHRRGDGRLKSYHADRAGGLADDLVTALYRDTEGMIWIGMDKKGLDILDPKSDRFSHYDEHTTAKTLLSKGVWSICPDPRGGVWLGTQDGLNRCEHRMRFRVWDASNTRDLSDNRVLSIYRDQRQQLWVGTDRGLDRQRRDGRFEALKVTSELATEEAITFFAEDAKQQLWLGVYNQSVHRLRPDGRGFDHFPADGTARGPHHEVVYTMAPCPNGDIWFGTELGIECREAKSGIFKAYSLGKDVPVYVLEREQSGRLWVGSRYGLYTFDPESGSASPVKLNHDTSGNETITSFHEDEAQPKILWVGTMNGLVRYDREDGGQQLFDKRNRLPNNSVYAIVEDPRHRLWVSTSKGLLVTDKAFEHGRIFDQRDGLTAIEFNGNASFRDGDRIYFGSTAGLVALDPYDLPETRSPLTVRLTEFLLDNKVPATRLLDPSSPLPAAIGTVDEMVLNHHQRMIGFTFATDDSSAPWHNLYRYRMQGFDRAWITTDAANRRATYTNLPPGSYDFTVQAASADGYWSEHNATLRLQVLAPPWLRWWAKTLYALIAALLLGGYLYMERQKLWHEREIANQQRLLAEKDRATANRLRELDKLKDQFLANTSHELRTPLNGIIGLADGLLADAGQLPPAQRADLAMIVSSGRRLTSLINDIMDFSLLRRGELEVFPGPVNLQALGQMILALNRPLLRGKSIELLQEFEADLPPVHADETRLGQVLQNLIGNAIKFTKRGSIVLWAKRGEPGKVLIGVRDTGIGIAEEARESIFLAFQQADGGVAREYGGTGLGLAITRRLVNLHGSEIQLQSTPGEGSDFCFSLTASSEPMPSELVHDTVTKIHTDPGLEAAISQAASPADGLAMAPLICDEAPPRNGGFRILVVDDEPVNRRVLVNHLEPKGYQVLEAGDGERGLQLIDGADPDLILLDIMMPGLSGYEVCARLRDKFSMEELPVIFLTARNRVDDMVTAFQAGANDFLAKPVAREELLVRVNTHLRLLDINRELEVKVVERSRALITSQKLASVGILASGIAHEINNPNNFVNGGAQIIRELIDELEEQPANSAAEPAALRETLQDMRAQTEMICDGSRRIDNVVKQLRAFTNHQGKSAQRVDLLANLDVIGRLVQAQFEEVPIERPQGHSCFVTCNPSELTQALLCILVNACEAVLRRQLQEPTRQGGVRIRYLETPTHLELTFEDSGDGIKPEHMDHLFEAFFTTKRGTTTAGLGLYTAWEIVSGHGGSIEASSQLGIGSSFRVRIPLTPS